jgi:hypothetical protein
VQPQALTSFLSVSQCTSGSTQSRTTHQQVLISFVIKKRTDASFRVLTVDEFWQKITGHRSLLQLQNLKEIIQCSQECFNAADAARSAIIELLSDTTVHHRKATEALAAAERERVTGIESALTNLRKPLETWIGLPSTAGKLRGRDLAAMLDLASLLRQQLSPASLAEGLRTAFDNLGGRLSMMASPQVGCLSVFLLASTATLSFVFPCHCPVLLLLFLLTGAYSHQLPPGYGYELCLCCRAVCQP